MRLTAVDMTVGKEWKAILRFAIPIFISSLFQQLYNIIDSLIVGNTLGDNALAAVSTSGNLIFLFTSFFIGCFSGAGVLISKHFGAKEYDEMQRTIHTGICFALIAGIFLTTVGVLLTPYILQWMNTDPLVLPESIDYFRWYFILVMGVVLYNCFAGTLQAVGNSTVPLIFLIGSSVLNVGLDFLFIVGFKMGVKGASIATGVSQLISALLCFIFLLRKGTVYQVRINKIRIHWDKMKLILKYGVPAGVQNSVIGIANVVVQSNLNTFGNYAMAGYGIYAKIEGFAFLPVTSFTLSLTTFTGQNLGAKQYDRAKRGSIFGFIASMAIAEVIGATMFFFMPYIARLFTRTTEVIDYSSLQARVICLFYLLLAFSHCAAAIQRGAGRSFIPMIIMLSIWCVFRVAYVNIAMSINHNIVLLYIIYPITWMMSSIIYLLIHIFSDWTHGFEKKKQQPEVIENTNS